MTALEMFAAVILSAMGLALLYAVISASVELWRAVRRMMQ